MNKAISLTAVIAVLLLTTLAVAPCAEERDSSRLPPKKSLGNSRAIVGAIRWDAWHGDKSNVGRAVETALGPKRWHYRVPFFGEIVSDTQVAIRGYTQEIVDREIAYAHQAGLDYWAFGFYDASLPCMVEARNLYLASRHKADINFCLWSGPNDLVATQNVHRIVQLMREPTYQKVLGDRPLFYLGFVDDKWMEILSERQCTEELRRQARQAGLGQPYLVLMDFWPAKGKKIADALGLDAISTYSCAGNGCGAPYAALAEHVENFWEQCKAAGAHMVPIVMTSADRRPRVEHPVPWEKYQRPGVGMEKFYETPTPAELSGHLEHALSWIRKNPDITPARAVIIYAWNENDEGGWLIPTRDDAGRPDKSRIQAVSRVLRPVSPAR